MPGLISRWRSQCVLVQRLSAVLKFFRKHLLSGKSTVRQYPRLPPPINQPRRPISFVVVRFSDEYLHNILQSECIKNPINELITVDNTSNLYYDNLTEAMAVGISQARHELIAVVHEDVVLPDGWQSWFEASLEALEMHDPNWGVLSSVGWTDDNKVFGHWSDLPYGYVNSFAGKKFQKIARLDEQILIFNRARPIELDHNLPGIHHVGRDIFVIAQQQGMKTYAIDAPTVHKYADQDGNIINTNNDSLKLTERKTFAYEADRACCNEYIVHKWPQLKIPDYKKPQLMLPDMDDTLRNRLNEPIILLVRGGSGSRLLSSLCQESGVFLGNRLNGAGDSLEMVLPVYQGILEKYRAKARWQKQQIVPRLRAAAANMLIHSGHNTGLWGFKLPESILLLPELCTAFPKARFLHMVRDPLATCLRRSHMTARLDNCIGRISLPLAYDYIGRPRKKILADSTALHMAYTTIHQLEIVASQLSDMGFNYYMQIRFEDLIENPTDCCEEVSKWLNVARKKNRLETFVDWERILNPKVVYPSNIEEKVENVLYSIRMKYKYI